jgi:hypothetical protein
VPRPATSPDARPDGGAPTADWNDRLAAAQPQEFADLFHKSVTADFGVAARLHQILETASSGVTPTAPEAARPNWKPSPPG